MIILKILFVIIIFYYFITTFQRFIFPYISIYYDIKGIRKNIDTYLFFEIILIPILLILAWIIDEQQFIFNLRDAFIWLVGIFVFLCIQLRGVLFLYSLFRKKL